MRRAPQAHLDGPHAGAYVARVAPRLASCRLRARDDLGSGYCVLHFAPDEPIDGAAGTFAMVRSESWGASPLLARPMSLLTAGAAPSILIKVIGEGTRRMATAPVGEVFSLLAPLGKPWSLPAPGQTAICVAGGVGVAPLVYLARELAKEKREVVSLYGGRTKNDLPLAWALDAVGRLEVTTEDGSLGTAGRVTAVLERELEAARDKNIKLYACGPHGMMAAVAAMAERYGVPCDASLEAPMGCGYGVCLGCPVAKRDGGYLYTCVDGPCVDATKVDWAVRVF
jgi:dihydroorotate dehydrogenase electron transfer subunit